MTPVVAAHSAQCVIKFPSPPSNPSHALFLVSPGCFVVRILACRPHHVLLLAAGGANEVLNERAVAVMKRMSDKLTGRDFMQVSSTAMPGKLQIAPVPPPAD